MRHGTSSRRNRNRSNNGRRSNGQQRTQVFDSNGPDVRIRGTAHQVAEKYLALAKDASSSGDHTIAENYYQHAEHYIRIINEFSNAQDTESIKGLRDSKPVQENEGNKVENKASVAIEDLSLPASILGPDVSVEKVHSDQETETAD